MKTPKFRVGQSVRFVGNPYQTNAPGRFTVERSLPEEHGEIHVWTAPVGQGVFDGR